MVQSPPDDDPVQHPDAATARRNLVIGQLRDQGSITAVDAAAATAQPLGVNATPAVPDTGCTAAGDAGYFCAYAVSYLQQAGFTAEQLSTGGYTIHTTLDPGAMEKAKAAVDGQVPRSSSWSRAPGSRRWSTWRSASA